MLWRIQTSIDHPLARDIIPQDDHLRPSISSRMETARTEEVMPTDIEERAQPSFSMAERDRRWGRVRQLMRERGIDVLVAPPNTGSNDKFQADARYLTQFGMNGEQVACIFPVDGKVIGMGGPTA